MRKNIDFIIKILFCFYILFKLIAVSHTNVSRLFITLCCAHISKCRFFNGYNEILDCCWCWFVWSNVFFLEGNLKHFLGRGGVDQGEKYHFVVPNGLIYLRIKVINLFWATVHFDYRNKILDIPWHPIFHSSVP